MKKILITDTHFGVKQNSSIWLKSQTDFIYDELIPYIKSQKEEVVIYHLGDVFDSRSSINPMVASKVRQVFVDLAKLVHIYIIAGNHDYYSPNRNEDNINSIDLLLSDINNCELYTDKCDMVISGDLFVPWFAFDDIDDLQSYINGNSVKNIFCHTDLSQLDEEHKKLFKNVNVYSGHIHYPFTSNNFYNLGSTFALTFADCNSERGFYVLNDNNLEFHSAKNIIKFYRFYNKEIFDIDYNSISNDYVELYIDKSNLLNDEYTTRVAIISKVIHNINVIPIDEQSIRLDSDITFSDYNIIDICRSNIPDKLYKKFDQILTNPI